MLTKRGLTRIRLSTRYYFSYYFSIYCKSKLYLHAYRTMAVLFSDQLESQRQVRHNKNSLIDHKHAGQLIFHADFDWKQKKNWPSAHQNSFYTTDDGNSRPPSFPSTRGTFFLFNLFKEKPEISIKQPESLSYIPAFLVEITSYLWNVPGRLRDFPLKAISDVTKSLLRRYV